LHHKDIEIISADEAFKDLTDRYGKAGALLKGIRVREGLTQIEFAKLIGTSQANLSSMENGTRPIGKNKAKLIADQFGVDYRYFL
jgi:transcriptional regulator with XRE-family HTH domain